MGLNVLLLSGGTRVAVHVGALRAIEETGADIAAWAGVSAGSLVAAVRACGYSQDKAFDLMLQTDYRRFLDVRPWSLLRGYGLFAGDAFESWLDDVLEGRRFEDLFDPLTVVATDVATGQPALFSPDTTPEMKIATAVRCSISIPGVFAARRINGRAFVDGCLARIEPQLLFANRLPSAVVRMAGTGTSSLPQNKRLNLSRYIRRIAQLVSDSIDSRAMAEEWDYDLRIDVGPSSGINFGQDHTEKRRLHDRAYHQCQRMLNDAKPHTHVRVGVPSQHWPCYASPEQDVAAERQTRLSISGAFH